MQYLTTAWCLSCIYQKLWDIGRIAFKGQFMAEIQLSGNEPYWPTFFPASVNGTSMLLFTGILCLFILHHMSSIAFLFLSFSTFLSYSVIHQVLLALFPPGLGHQSPLLVSSSFPLPSFHCVCTVSRKESRSNLNQLMSVLLKLFTVTLSFQTTDRHLLFRLPALLLHPHGSCWPYCFPSSLDTYLQGFYACSSLSS